MADLVAGSPALQATARNSRFSGPSFTAAERRSLLLAVDLVLIVSLGTMLSWIHLGPGNIFALTVPMAIAWLIVGHFSGLYTLASVSRLRDALLVISRTAVVAAAALLFLFYLHPYVISRSDVLTLALTVPVLIAVWRVGYVVFLGAARFQRRVLIVGAGAACQALLREVRSRHGHGIAVLGIVDDDPAKQGTYIEGVPVLSTPSALHSLVSSLGIEEVVLSITHTVQESVLEGVGACYESGVIISLMPHLYEEVSGQVPVAHMGRGWLGSVTLGHTGGSLRATVKRLLDIVVSTVGLVFAFPLMVAIALAVRLSSPGPILFRQQRFGLHGRPFDVLKFRTMTVDAGGSTFNGTDRAKITRVGRWLRRAHLDELPQLFLILRGDMSLVGPRPKRADEARELERSIPLYRVRYRVRPGLTGWAQIQYRYARSPEDEMNKLGYDLYYVRHQSLLLDLSILVRTVGHVLGMRGF